MNKTSLESGVTVEFLLSPIEAVVAGTLALMTAMAQEPCDDHRAMIRGKVIANLAELEQHPHVSRQFRAAVSHLQQHWYALEDGAGSGSFRDRALWHKPGEKVQ